MENPKPGNLVYIKKNSIVYIQNAALNVLELGAPYMAMEDTLGMYLKSYSILEAVVLVKNRFLIVNISGISIANGPNSR